MKKLWKVFVIGDLCWTDQQIIAAHYLELANNFTLRACSGDYIGASKIAGSRAMALGIPTMVYPHAWKRGNITANIERHILILEEWKPDMVIGYHDSIKKSKVTKAVLAKAYEMGMVVELMSLKGQVFIKRKK